MPCTTSPSLVRRGLRTLTAWTPWTFLLASLSAAAQTNPGGGVGAIDYGPVSGGIAPIPTLGEWGLLLLALAVAVLAYRQRKRFDARVFAPLLLAGGLVALIHANPGGWLPWAHAAGADISLPDRHGGTAVVPLAGRTFQVTNHSGAPQKILALRAFGAASYAAVGTLRWCEVNMRLDAGQSCYARIEADGGCAALPDGERGTLTQEAAGGKLKYVSRSGNWVIEVNKYTINVLRIICGQAPGSWQIWGDGGHANLNGKHVKDWLITRNSVLLDDGTKITMHANAPNDVVRITSIYDGPHHHEIDNDNNTVRHSSADAAEAAQHDAAEADGETISVALAHEAGSFMGYLYARIIYTQPSPGPAPQCVGQTGADCVDVRVARSGDLDPVQGNPDAVIRYCDPSTHFTVCGLGPF